MDIGGRIKSIRLKRGLTQEELALRSELTKGYISQLENDLASPSIATLIDILNVLGVTPQAFFAEEKEEQRVFGKTDFFVSPNGGGEATWLIPNSQKNEMEPIMLSLYPGQSTPLDNPHEGEEFGYVLEGSILVCLDNQKFRCKKGESFYYECDKPHYLKNTSSGISKVIWISSPPNF